MAQVTPVRIEIVYWEAEQPVLHVCTLEAGSTLAQALRACRLCEMAEDWIRHSGGIGLRGRLARADERLEDGDRIEFLRPLEADATRLRLERVRAVRKLRQKKRTSSGQDPLPVADDPHDSPVSENELKPDHPGPREMAGLPVEDIVPLRS